MKRAFVINQYSLYSHIDTNLLPQLLAVFQVPDAWFHQMPRKQSDTSIITCNFNTKYEKEHFVSVQYLLKQICK